MLLREKNKFLKVDKGPGRNAEQVDRLEIFFRSF